MEIRAPYLPLDSLRPVAIEFLDKHHPDGTIPIPIEHIIEFGLDMDIVTVPRMQERFEVESYLTKDQKEIHVDEGICENVPNRYRFSLAHEVSHLLIHQDVLSGISFSSVVEWKTAIESISEQEYGWIEWQAYALAGLILVPSVPLEEEFRDVVARAELAGVSITNPSDDAKRLLAGQVARKFAVSTDVIERRMSADNLWEL